VADIYNHLLKFRTTEERELAMKESLLK
jgi:hypothetical protein